MSNFAFPIFGRSMSLVIEAARVLAISRKSSPRARCAVYAAAHAASSNFGTTLAINTVEELAENGGASLWALSLLNFRIASVETVTRTPSSSALVTAEIAETALPSGVVGAEARTLL